MESANFGRLHAREDGFSDWCLHCFYLAKWSRQVLAVSALETAPVVIGVHMSGQGCAGLDIMGYKSQ